MVKRMVLIMKEDKNRMSIVEWIFIVVLINLFVWLVIRIHDGFDKGMLG